MDLIVLMNPVGPNEIYQVSSKGSTLKVKDNINHPTEIISYISQVASTNKKVNVTFIGPTDYTNKYIQEANQIDFVKAQ